MEATEARPDSCRVVVASQEAAPKATRTTSGSSAWDLDRDVFERLTIGSFLEGSYATYDRNRDPLNCVQEALSSASILEMEGTMSLEGMNVTPVQHAYGADAGRGGLEGDADDLINALLGSIFPRRR